MATPFVHEVKYFTRKTTADARARCTCGWFTFGSLDECVDAAMTHADWEEVTPDERQPYNPYPGDKISVASDGPGATASVSIVPGRVLDQHGNEVPQ